MRSANIFIIMNLLHKDMVPVARYTAKGARDYMVAMIPSGPRYQGTRKAIEDWKPAKTDDRWSFRLFTVTRAKVR